MPSVQVNGLSIAYEDHPPASSSSGSVESAPVILLIHGLGTPLTGWPRSYWQPLVNAGCRVLLIDNRDVGQSSRVPDARLPTFKDLAVASLFKKRIKADYTLEDMAADAIGLLDGLNIPKAHVVGASMGGMIGQLLAARYPDRISSLTAVMTSTGAKHLPGPSLSVRMRLLNSPKDRSPENLIQHSMKTWKVIGSPAYPAPDDKLYDYVKGIHQRGISSQGYLRHMAAILASGDRSELMKTVSIPTLVLHGGSDKLVPAACGRQLAGKIPNARYQEFEGMGHDFPEQLAERISGLILEHTASY
ncbi:alpha/beta fold hydrolase [Parendozoicomonas haliclonae]|uniref:3-oxoadipate enol-lactonase 2 n=1 Tax=Parendozoicomonas haliclonae TaxID=1960125 RepID=A0A1X7AGD7_9GAMM|nr:alpha/beta hydrolase [Parendozoicomonas haliclonae]SMA32743.1 3-oxoadipate enol-lactonase 2 [Parendozoicomonas haliclonae]